jgi:hypothetical protein
VEDEAMRFVYLVLLICTGVPSLCQSTTFLYDYTKTTEDEPSVAAPPTKSSKPPTKTLLPSFASSIMDVRSGSITGWHWDNAQADSKKSLRPPPLSIDAQPSGSLMALNGFSNFLMQVPPWPNAKLVPIPTQWPDARIEQIPTEWPDLKLDK